MQGGSWRLSAFETLGAMCGECSCGWEGKDASDRLFLFLFSVAGPGLGRKLTYWLATAQCGRGTVFGGEGGESESTTNGGASSS